MDIVFVAQDVEDGDIIGVYDSWGDLKKGVEEYVRSTRITAAGRNYPAMGENVNCWPRRVIIEIVSWWRSDSP